ncbi:hypothetical protein Tco_0035165, partial [Tanacetum coccineum]
TVGDNGNAGEAGGMTAGVFSPSGPPGFGSSFQTQHDGFYLYVFLYVTTRPGQSHIRRGDSLSVSSRSFGRSVDDVKDLHEVLPVSKSELSESVNVLYKKLDEQDVEVVPPEPLNPDSNSPDPVYSDIVSDFSVSE